MSVNCAEHFEKIVDEQEIFVGKVFKVSQRDVILENGEQSKRDIVYHNGGVGILPVDEDGNVYFVRQYRSAFDSEILEIPAGKLEKDENHLDAGKRELKEETGFSAKEFIYLGEYWPTVGYCTEKIYLYLAKGLTAGEIDFDDDEFITTEKMPYKQMYNMCMDDEIKDGKTQIAVFKASKYLKMYL